MEKTKDQLLMIGGVVIGRAVLAFIFVFWMSNFAGGGSATTIGFQSSGGGDRGYDHGLERRIQRIKVGEVCRHCPMDPAEERAGKVKCDQVSDGTTVRPEFRW